MSMLRHIADDLHRERSERIRCSSGQIPGIDQLQGRQDVIDRVCEYAMH
jgi:hypothetical protein